MRITERATATPRNFMTTNRRLLLPCLSHAPTRTPPTTIESETASLTRKQSNTRVLLTDSVTYPSNTVSNTKHTTKHTSLTTVMSHLEKIDNGQETIYVTVIILFFVSITLLILSFTLFALKFNFCVRLCRRCKTGSSCGSSSNVVSEGPYGTPLAVINPNYNPTTVL